jgi:hypothetical protein
MASLQISVVREEIISLLNESAQEFQRAEPDAELSLLLEAQFLLSEAIQSQLSKTRGAPPLSPFPDEFIEESDQGLITFA